MLLLLGCSVFQNKMVPQTIKSPKKWHTQDSRLIPSKKPINLSAWWEKFKDPSLNLLIQEALINNSDISIARGNMLQARALLRKVQVSWLPTLSVAGLGFGTEKFNKPLQVGLTEWSNFNGYFAGFIPNYTVNILKQLKEGKVALLNIELQEAIKNGIRLGIISQITGSYFSLVGLKEELILQEKMVKDAKALRQHVDVQYRHGAISNIKVAALDQYIAELRQKIPDIRLEIIKIQNTLCVLVNKNPGNIDTVLHFDQIKVHRLIPLNLPSEMLRIRPDIAIAEYKLRISHAQVDVFIASLFPTISLSGLIGAASLQFGPLLGIANTLTFGDIFASMPIFKPEIYANISKARAKKYTDFYHFQKVVRSAFAEVENGLSQYSLSYQKYGHQFAALKDAERQYSILKTQYKLGAISYSDTLIAKLNVDFMELQLNEIKIKQMNSIVNLYQVLGGGYSAT